MITSEYESILFRTSKIIDKNYHILNQYSIFFTEVILLSYFLFAVFLYIYFLCYVKKSTEIISCSLFLCFCFVEQLCSNYIMNFFKIDNNVGVASYTNVIVLLSSFWYLDKILKIVPRTLCCFHWTFRFESWMLLTGENIVTFLLRKYLVIVSNEMTRATVNNVVKSFLLILSLHLFTGFLLVVSMIVIKYFYRSHHNVHWT